MTKTEVREKAKTLTDEQRQDLAATLRDVARSQDEFWNALEEFELELATILEIRTFSLSSSDDFTGYGDTTRLSDEALNDLIDIAEEII